MAALRVNFFAAAFLVVLSVDLCAAAPVNDTKSSHNNPDSAGSRENTKAKEGKNKKLGDDPACADDISQFCHEVDKGNNLAILVCLQDKAKEDDVSDDCHHMLWQYKKSLVNDARLADAAMNYCKEDLDHLPECNKVPSSDKTELIPCLLENRQNITKSKCKHLMTKLQAVVFSNYRLIKGFINDCSADVGKFKCGRLVSEEEEEDVHEQNDVVECLEEHQEDLSESCQKEIFRMAELSADDYHLDRPLYYACRDDREKFCANIASGEGKVYKCLMKHKFENTMSQECRDKLTVRQKIQSDDAKADFTFFQSCKKDYRKYEDKYDCGKGKTRHGMLANVLLCLEAALNDGQPVDSKCQSEMFDLRQQLMEDFSINPEVVRDCEKEINDHCLKGTEKEGKTIDCLMKLGEEHNLSKQCYKAVASLLKETGAGGDYRIDHTLYKACEPVVRTACHEKGQKDGDIMILSCLMENMNSDHMFPECREQLLHLEFFLARDFSLDPQLYKVCKEDARAVCHARDWQETDDVPSNLIVSCLYRNSKPGVATKVSKNCAAHVKRVMHLRAEDINLLPEVQEECMADLGRLCGTNIEKGAELECLQEHYEQLMDQCKKAVGTFTEEEGEDYELDRKLVHACSAMVSKFCQDAVQTGAAEDVLPCLIENKNDVAMDHKCHAAIEHWQLTEMKDFKFSDKFKRLCRDDVEAYCHDKDIKSKHDIIKCLSGNVRDAVLDGQEHTISEKCRKQLKFERFQEAENIQFDPDIYGKCKEDVEKYCKNVTPGSAKVYECLKDNRHALDKECYRQLFKREEMEAKHPDLDYRLVRACKRMIKFFCKDSPPNEILKCLKSNKNAPEMEDSCREMITKRQIIQAEDIHLNPSIIVACHQDMPKFCDNIEHGSFGQVISCLKEHYTKLSDECAEKIRTLIETAAKDYRLDARLKNVCGTEVEKLCKDIDPGHGQVEECLRDKIAHIDDKACRIEVARTMREGRYDVKADPLLYKACAHDINRYCIDVPFGHGQVIRCLLDVHKKNTPGNKLDKECYMHLTGRMRMWEVAAKVVPMDSLGDIAMAITLSPSKNYFFVIFATVLALIFLGGLIFGRLSKRVKREMKDR